MKPFLASGGWNYLSAVCMAGLLSFFFSFFLMRNLIIVHAIGTCPASSLCGHVRPPGAAARPPQLWASYV